jgi:lysophospholipase L1-like esterase
VEEERLHNDWANLARYRAENARLVPPKPGERRVVFMGNSITEGWARHFPTMFPGKPYVGRGIGGQTTPQMLVRFRQDVIALEPAVVVILAGTNDIAGNTGPSTLEMIQDNLASMAELARANGIRVVLSSVLPVYDYPWRPGLEPAPKIVALNAWMRDYAARNGAVYLDYHSAMADGRGGLRRGLGDDGVHPNEAGYRIMAPLAERAIAEALRPR